MIKPLTVVEFGTGFGTTSFMAAQGCKENGFGTVLTIDDGSQNNFVENYSQFIKNKIIEFGLTEHIQFFNETLNWQNMNTFKFVKDVGIVFNDIDGSPKAFFDVLVWLLPRKNKECYFFIDRGATFLDNYYIMQNTIRELNNGRIPKYMLDVCEDKKQLEEIIKTTKFSTHCVKKHQSISSTQDSFAIIKMEEFYTI
jgi:hypothetical protein